MFRRGYGGPQADCFDERELFAHCLLIAELIKLRKFLMDDYSKKLGEMFGGLDYYS